MLEDHQRLINRFTGKDAIPLDDAFWNELLAFPFPLSKLNPQEVDAATRQACAQLGEDHGASLPEFEVSAFTRIKWLPGSCGGGGCNEDCPPTKVPLILRLC